jgi:ABC-type antimicrobial peptide transport system permease subunit
VIACVGLYGTMAYAVARRTRDIGIRMALGARRGIVIWMVLREVCVLATLGLAIGVPIALGTSRLIESFLFDMKPNDPRALALAVTILSSRSDDRSSPRVRAIITRSGAGDGTWTHLLAVLTGVDARTM